MPCSPHLSQKLLQQLLTHLNSLLNIASPFLRGPFHYVIPVSGGA